MVTIGTNKKSKAETLNQRSRLFFLTASISLFVLLCIFTAYNINMIVRSPRLNSTIERVEILSEHEKIVTDLQRPHTCLKKHGPQPYILMSLGRSGTSSTAQVIGSLTGYDTPCQEYTGKDTHDSKLFFNQNTGTKWLTTYLCEMQKKYKKAAVIGFKWKPYPNAIYLPSSQEGLKLMAIQDNPQIKVVRSKRNLVDVYLSRKKHENDVAAHCTVGNTTCIKMHKESAVGLTIDTEDLLSFLKYTTTEEEKVDDMLEELGVPHIMVSYENLYNADNAEEWMRIFRFLGKGPTEKLTMKIVQKAMNHVSTSVPQSKSMSNYDEVANSLKGTSYENLLH